MAVLQREFEAGGFHVANDAPFQDERLSWEAKGVLGYLFSKPEDWTPRMYDIVQNGPCEKYKIKSVFEELEENGYMRREKVRGEDGTLDWEVTVSDHPRFDPGWEESTPDSDHPEEDGGYNNTDSQSDGQSTNTESEGAPARGEDQGEEESSRIQKLKRLKQGAWTKEEIRQHAKRKYGDPERWRTAIYQLAHPDYDPSVLVRDEWTEKISDPEAWAEAVWKGLKRRWQPTSVAAREDTYEEIARHVGGDGQPVEYNARGYRIE